MFPRTAPAPPSAGPGCGPPLLACSSCGPWCRTTSPSSSRTTSPPWRAAVSPYVTITIDEHAADSFSRSEAYRAAEAYLSATCAARAARLRADLPDRTDRVTLAVDDHVEAVDDFRGASLRWCKTKTLRRTNVIAWNPREEERRAYRLTFHRRHRALVEAAYLPHVLAEGRAATVRNRQRRLFTNNTSADWAAAGAEDGPRGPRPRVWSHVKLDHPSTVPPSPRSPWTRPESRRSSTTSRCSRRQGLLRVGGQGLEARLPAVRAPGHRRVHNDRRHGQLPRL